MKMAPHPALAHGKACHVGDPVAVVIADTLADAKDAAELVKVDYEVLPAVADPAKAQSAGAPQIHELAPNNTIYQWHLGDQQATEAAFKAAKHVTRLDLINNRLVPNAIEPRAALAEYDAGRRQLHPVEHDAEPARRPPRHRGVRRHGARAQAARDRARRGRRLRIEDLHLSRGGGGAVGGAAHRPPGEVGGAAHRSVHLRCAWPRSRHPCRDGVRRERQDPRAARQDHRQSRRLHVDLLVVGADLSLRDAVVGPVRHPAHLLRGRRGLHQHGAGRRLSRRGAAGSDLRGGAPGRDRARASWASSRPTCASATSSRRSRTRRRSSWRTTPATIRRRSRRRWRSPTTRASASASANSARRGKLRGIGFSTYIEACGIAPSQAVGSLGCGVGLWEIGGGAGQPDRQRRGADRVPRARPGPRDHVRAGGVGAARDSDRQHLHRARRHRQGAVRHGHLRVALGRGRHVGDRQGARQGRGQGQEGRRLHARGGGRRHRVQGRQVHGRRNRQIGRMGRGRAQCLHRAQVCRRRTWSPA